MCRKIEVTQDQLAEAFTEWRRRARENPNNCPEFDGTDEEFGTADAEVLVGILDELAA